jgi:hypothetical protein
MYDISFFCSTLKCLILETPLASIERVKAVIRLLKYLIDNRKVWMSIYRFRTMIFYKVCEFKIYRYENNDIPISYETIERIHGLCQEIEYA